MAPQSSTTKAERSKPQEFSSSSSLVDPLNHVISFSSSLPPKSENGGVVVPPLLQELFGVYYLPRQEQQYDGSSPLPSTRLIGGDAENSIPSTVESINEEEENLQESALTDASLKKEKKKSGLASRMRERRRQRKQGSVDSTNTWIQKQQAKLQQQKATLQSIQYETEQVETRAKNLQQNVSSIQQQVSQLEETLANSLEELQQDAKLLAQSKKELKKLETKRNKAACAVQETSAAIQAGPPSRSRPPRISKPRKSLDDDPVLSPMLATSINLVDNDNDDDVPPRRRADSEPTPVLSRALSSSFIRVHDLEMDNQTPSLSETSSSLTDEATDVFFLDHDVATVLNALAKSGWELATDESDRFVPALSTEKLLSQYDSPQDLSWPIPSWKAPQGKDVFVWVGSVDHNGYGCQLPVFKARAIIPATPREVLDLVLDSSRATEYNKMSQGRTDVLILQSNVHTTAQESEFGVAGEAKIIRSLNKPPLIRKSIEMLSLIYARPHVEGSYLAVNRSVWEDSSAEAKPSKDLLRSEILLGVNIFRPVPGPDEKVYCEMTTITHAHTTVVPDAIARKMGPTQAATFLKEVQEIFSKQQKR